MEKELHLFDFDGTLTKKDSLFHFLKFAAPRLSESKNYKLIFLKSLPTFLLAMAGLKEKANVKRSFISSFINNEKEETLNAIAEDYAQNISDLMRVKALEKIKALKNNPNASVYFVSASLDVWLKPIAKKLGVGLICTKAQVEGERYTGYFDGENCNDIQKEIRIKLEIELSQYDKVFAYGDTDGDKAMLNLADESFFKPFH